MSAGGRKATEAQVCQCALRGARFFVNNKELYDLKDRRTGKRHRQTSRSRGRMRAARPMVEQILPRWRTNAGPKVNPFKEFIETIRRQAGRSEPKNSRKRLAVPRSLTGEARIHAAHRSKPAGQLFCLLQGRAMNAPCFPVGPFTFGACEMVCLAS
jgi:hypothetical protein